MTEQQDGTADVSSRRADVAASGSPRPPGTPPRIPVLLAQLCVAVAGSLVVLGELDRLVTGAITTDGASRSLTDLVGPLGAARGDVWEVWAGSQFRTTVAVTLGAHLLADAALIAAYALLLRRVTTRSVVARRTLWVVVAADLVENAGLAVGAVVLALGHAPDWLRWPLAAVTTGKWLAALVLVVAVVRNRPVRRRTAVGVLAAVRALWYQRLSVLVVVVLSVLSVVPMPDIWDQLPDVQRRWADGTAESWRHLGFALLLLVVVTGQLFVLGRLRSERAWQTYVTRRTARLRTPSRWWLTAPAMGLTVALALVASGNRDLVDPGPLVVVVVGPSLLWLVSVVMHHRWPQPLVVPRVRHRGRARRAWWVGDLLAALVPTLAGLGLVRSFTAPLVLGPDRVFGWGDWTLQLLLWSGGIALAGLAVPAVDRLARAVDGPRPGTAADGSMARTLVRLLRPERIDGAPARGPLRGVPIALWLLSVGLLVAFLLFPIRLPALLGVVATVEAVLSAWVVIVGYVLVHLQHQQPLEVFRALRITSNPVIALLVGMPLVTSYAGGDPDLHSLRPFPVPQAQQQPPAPPPRVERQRLDGALADWVARSGACDRTVQTPDGPVTVRPMVLLAAQGGGIRAATWTAAALDRLRAHGPCAATAVALSSGVSGGSVGLALGRDEAAAAEARELAAPDALASALSGLLVGDLLGGAAGLRVPAVDGDGHWLDRAGLMETVWEDSAPVLAEHYDARVRGAGGALVLNSTAAGLGCRVLVSQVDPRDPTRARYDALAPNVSGGTGEPRCRALTALPPASLDLQSLYGSCAPDMSWATAAMLSARFPTVTPAGRVPSDRQRQPDGTVVDCSTLPDLQLVDGGYAEGSGLGTLTDLAPGLSQAVRRHNARALGSDGPVLVPVVAFLQNASRADLAVPPTGLTAELLVPLAGIRARDLQAADGTWMQRVGDALADPCPQALWSGGSGADSRCAAAVRTLREPVTGGLVVVAPRTRPAIDPPLGWTMSAASQQRLVEAMDDQAERCSGPRPGGYACLRDLLRVLEPGYR